MTFAPLNIGFIGGGINSAVGYAHLAAIRLDRRFQVVCGAFSQEEAQNLETAKVYGIEGPNVFWDWRELLSKHKNTLDAVAVLTPTPTHKEIVIKCLQNNLPVICEKALCLNAIEAIEIQKALEEQNGFLAVTYNYSGYPMLRELKEKIKNGDLGNIQQVHIEMPQEGFLRKNPETNSTNLPQSWRQTDSTVSTLALDLGVHIHHLIDFLTGEKPIELVAKEDHFGSIANVIDNVVCITQYTNNMLATAWFGKCALGHRNGLRVRIFGSEGSAEWFQMDPENLHLSDIYGTRRIIDRSDPANRIAIQSRYNRFKPGHPDGFIEAFANYYCDIADKLLQKQPSKDEGYVAGIEVAIESMRFLEAISLSSESREWIKITAQ